MARFHVEELYGEDVVASNMVDAPDALSAAQTVAGKAISPRVMQDHWFRVVDEAEGTVHESALRGAPGGNSEADDQAV